MTGRWKLFVAFVAVVLAVASVVAVRQASDDITTRDLLKQNIEQDQRIEAAREERVQQINRINEAQCDALQQLYRTIRRTLVESDKQIDTIAYYRANPAEAAAVHARNKQILEDFAVPPCPEDIALATSIDP